MGDLKGIIEVIVAIATVFSLVVIWLTLKEMKIQRKKSYEPCIIPLNFEVHYLCNYPKTLLPIKKYLNVDNIKINSSLESPFLTLKNIGQGVAKDISIKIFWKVEYQKYLATLKSKFDKLNVALDLKVDANSCWLNVDEERKVLSGGNYPYENNHNQNFDYLPPIRDQHEEIKLEFPSSVNLVLELSILLIECLPNSNKKKAFNQLQNCFEPRLEINYKDSLGGKFSSCYTLSIKKSEVRMQSDVDGKIYKLMFERKI
ncbi:hypothetical protein SAMN04487891_105116 [Flagellimonas taeanensis]|uniref:Uncharacterized protein n=1 Tax=Flagellimonas taeanensis TaxID=1005926 RepID=A0A1M6Y4U3_9FLAO|nr:hypothetical protein [Allomuricauda taeanensis]SFC05333.1 hypothetical protein SAMN04487891_105116 [Allomuricauda taeanensis]SHL13015.1 hypothetical protein SAMN05216293_2718 [Allomuricauda taeanensis]